MKLFSRVLLFMLTAWLLTGLARVRSEERAVVRRFGKVVAHPGPGLWVGWPWGIDRIDRIVTKGIRQTTVGQDDERELPFLTGDQNLVETRLVLDYAIGESDQLLDDYLMNQNTIEAVLTREAESLTAEWLAGRGVDEALLVGRAELPLWLMTRLPGRLVPYRLGIVVLRASVDRLAAPAEVRDAFEAVNQAQSAIRTREAAAQREAEQRLQQAATLQFQWRQQASAYRAESTALAQADAQRFARRLEQFRRAQAANADALAAIWWDEMGRTLLALRGRGRLDILDSYLGPDGLDITQFLPPKR